MSRMVPRTLPEPEVSVRYPRDGSRNIPLDRLLLADFEGSVPWRVFRSRRGPRRGADPARSPATSRNSTRPAFGSTKTCARLSCSTLSAKSSASRWSVPKDCSRWRLDRPPVVEFRDIPVPEYVNEAIDKHVAELGTTSDGHLFQGRKYKLVVRRSYQEDFQRAAARAGLPPEFIPHSLRHFYASVALAEGIPITEVSRWLGHN